MLVEFAFSKNIHLQVFFLPGKQSPAHARGCFTCATGSCLLRGNRQPLTCSTRLAGCYKLYFKEKTVNHLLCFLQPWVVRFNPELPQLLPKGSSRAGNAGAGMSSVLAVVGGFQARKDFKSPGSLIPVVGHQGG